MKKLLLFFLIFILEGFILWGIGKLLPASRQNIAGNTQIAVKTKALKAGI